METYGRRAMILFVSSPPINVTAGLQFHTNPCWIRDCQSGAATGLSPSTFDFPLSVSSHKCSVLIHPCHALRIILATDSVVK